MNARKQLIEQSSLLNQSSKIDLFNFINTNVNVSFMENTNGIFFSLNDIDDNQIETLLEEIRKLKEIQELHQPLGVGDIEKTETLTLSEMYPNDAVDVNVSTDSEVVANTCKPPFHYDKNLVKELENHINKSSKKSIHVKYSLAKKKYNKQTYQAEIKKIDNTDLNELKEEVYIL
ncbi:hypothetical protein QKU58_gp155 [Pyramimonas orientalis virus]|uniref:NET domain-containing protein n=1 Tax=Pyramimonas orientalis virus 01B TaxID=3134525 RepID=A0A7M4CER8_9VIRU|nr:hypothetical protein QKU58_gp155 [Pyramimonas orientalis virus]QOI90176.1 hypothetical protein HWQ62_00039 [Pyramimonas orientalis virus]